MTQEKHFISANELLEQSWQLAAKVWQDDYRPDVIVGLWRGGAPVAIAVHEYLSWKGHCAQHFPLVARSYQGTNRRDSVEMRGLEVLVDAIPASSSILLVDDVLDTGNTLYAVLQAMASEGFEQVRIATPWFKPGRVERDIEPHYWLFQTDRWLVFPHELADLDQQEVRISKPGWR